MGRGAIAEPGRGRSGWQGRGFAVLLLLEGGPVLRGKRRGRRRDLRNSGAGGRSFGGRGERRSGGWRGSRDAFRLVERGKDECHSGGPTDEAGEGEPLVMEAATLWPSCQAVQRDESEWWRILTVCVDSTSPGR